MLGPSLPEIQEQLREEGQSEDAKKAEGLHKHDLDQRNEKDQGQEVEFCDELHHFGIVIIGEVIKTIVVLSTV